MVKEPFNFTVKRTEENIIFVFLKKRLAEWQCVFFFSWSFQLRKTMMTSDYWLGVAFRP